MWCLLPIAQNEQFRALYCSSHRRLQLPGSLQALICHFRNVSEFCDHLQIYNIYILIHVLSGCIQYSESRECERFLPSGTTTYEFLNMGLIAYRNSPDKFDYEVLDTFMLNYIATLLGLCVSVIAVWITAIGSSSLNAECSSSYNGYTGAGMKMTRRR